MTKYFNLVTDTARKSILDYVASDAFVLSDYAEKNNLECELEKYMKYAYIDNLDSYDYIKELIKNTPEEYSKYNVSKEQLKRIVDSINDETYFEVVEQITKEVVEFRNKILGVEKDNTIEDSNVEKSDVNNHDDDEKKSEIEEDTNNEEVVAPVTVEADLNNCDIDSEEKSESEESPNSEEVTESATLEVEASDTNKEQNEDDVIEKKSVFHKLKGGRDKNKQKAFKLFAGLMKDAEGRDEDNQHKEESSSEATVAYQPAVANNLFENTGLINQISFSPASDFRTVEERISELFTRLMMETDRNKILYIVNQIINLVPDKEAFKKTLLSKLKGM